MFSSRSIHFALLGIILGASSGYVFAFYRASAALPPPITESEAQAQIPEGHPEVNSDQMLAAMQKAVEKDPKDPKILQRYAMALLEAGRLNEASESLGKAVQLEPDSVEARSMYGAVLWRIGNKAAAKTQLEASLKIEPKNITSLHVLTLIALEEHDAARAGQLIKQIEAIDPSYSQLAKLRGELDAERGKR